MPRGGDRKVGQACASEDCSGIHNQIVSQLACDGTSDDKDRVIDRGAFEFCHGAGFGGVINCASTNR